MNKKKEREGIAIYFVYFRDRFSFVGSHLLLATKIRHVFKVLLDSENEFKTNTI